MCCFCCCQSKKTDPSVVGSSEEVEIGDCWTEARKQFQEKDAALSCAFKAVLSERSGVHFSGQTDPDNKLLEEEMLEKAMMVRIDHSLSCVFKASLN